MENLQIAIIISIITNFILIIAFTMEHVRAGTNYFKGRLDVRQEILDTYKENTKEVE